MTDFNYKTGNEFKCKNVFLEYTILSGVVIDLIYSYIIIDKNLTLYLDDFPDSLYIKCDVLSPDRLILGYKDFTKYFNIIQYELPEILLDNCLLVYYISCYLHNINVYHLHITTETYKKIYQIYKKIYYECVNYLKYEQHNNCLHISNILHNSVLYLCNKPVEDPVLIKENPYGGGDFIVLDIPKSTPACMWLDINVDDIDKFISPDHKLYNYYCHQVIQFNNMAYYPQEYKCTYKLHTKLGINIKYIYIRRELKII